MASRTLNRAVFYLRKYGIGATAREVMFRLLRALNPTDSPAAVHVEVSNCCNLRCEYCVLDENAEGARIMSMETLDSLLPTLAKARRIDLSGLAEPLMNKRFVEMLAKVRAAAPRAHITVCTNATLMTEGISREFVEHGLDELVFSLDGVDPAVVDDVRRGGSLEGVIRNVATLRDVKQQASSATPVVTATVVLRPDNLVQLPATVALAAELGARAVNVNGLEPYSQELLPDAIWRAGDAPGLAATLQEAEDTARAAGIELRLPSMRLAEADCPQAFRPIVLADGTVVPCSVLAYHRPSLLAPTSEGSVAERQSEVERLAFGNVRERGLEAIWRSAEYREFRSRVKRGDFPQSCAACLLKHGVICPTPPLTAAQSIATIRDAEA